MIVFAALCASAGAARASHYEVIHALQGGAELAVPLSIAQAPSGTLFGVAQAADYSSTAVFRLDPPATGQTAWRYSILYSRTNKQTLDFITPRLLFDPSGGVYFGTNNPNGGGGSIYRLAPPPSGQTTWTANLVFHHYSRNCPYFNQFFLSYRSSGGELFGYDPNESSAVHGEIFKVSPPRQDAPDGVAVAISTFGRYVGDGQTPNGMILGADGSFYGTTAFGDGAAKQGSVFRLTPPAAGQTAWTRQVLHGFTSAGHATIPTGLIADRSRTLTGVTGYGGTARKGSVFRLTPPATGQTTWQESDLYSFKGGQDGAYPQFALVNLGGSLFGVTNSAGDAGCDCGTLFKVAAPAAGPQATPWLVTSLHRFGTSAGDAANPSGDLARVTLPGGGTALFGVTLRSLGGDGKTVPLGTIFQYVP